VTYNPNWIVSGASSTPKASPTVTGTVKADVVEADPLVYTKATTDTLLAAKAVAATVTTLLAAKADLSGGLVPIAEIPTGSTGTTVPFGNDARFSDARTPTAHVIATNVALGAQHTISGATAGHVLRASGATTALFAQLAHADLANVGTNTHAQLDTFVASKAGVSGLASLDGSSLVVQNPANATATAAASKIPIADGSAHLDTWLSDAAAGTKGKIQLAGHLGGSAASPTVTGIQETGGPTSLTIGAVTDGQALKRSGTTLIGATLPVWKQATIDFGVVAPTVWQSFTITDALVSASSIVTVFPGSTVPAGWPASAVDEWEMDPAVFTAIPASGSYTLNVAIQTPNGVVGTRSINYMVA
jgi:hypothetical protein